MDSNPSFAKFTLQAVYRKPVVLLLSLGGNPGNFQHNFYGALAGELSDRKLLGAVDFQVIHFDENETRSLSLVTSAEHHIKSCGMMVAWVDTQLFGTQTAREFFRLCQLRWNQDSLSSDGVKCAQYFMSPRAFHVISDWHHHRESAVKVTDSAQLGHPGEKRAQFTELKEIQEAAQLAAETLPHFFATAFDKAA